MEQILQGLLFSEQDGTYHQYFSFHQEKVQ